MVFAQVYSKYRFLSSLKKKKCLAYFIVFLFIEWVKYNHVSLLMHIGKLGFLY